MEKKEEVIPGTPFSEYLVIMLQLNSLCDDLHMNLFNCELFFVVFFSFYSFLVYTYFCKTKVVDVLLTFS